MSIFSFASVVSMMRLFLIFLLSVIFTFATSQESFPCGLANRGQIRKGSAVASDDIPWKAALFNEYDEYFCGGVLISESLVVTAAHCVHPKGTFRPMNHSDITVVLGAYNLTNHQHETSIDRRKNFKVRSIIVHQAWNSSVLAFKFNDDIALIKLSEKVTFSLTIWPVCVATNEVLQVKNALAVGWGTIDDSNAHSDIPYKIDVPIIKDRFQCVLENPKIGYFAWKDSICAGRPNAGVCKGDSGSGLFVNFDGRTYLRGIVSSTVSGKCSDTNLAIYTDIIKYLGFLQKEIENENEDGISIQKACSLKKDQGTFCNVSTTINPNNSSKIEIRHFFDSEYGGCSRFWYYGCEGNRNRFESHRECEEICIKPKGIKVCYLPMITGPCTGYYPNYYYNNDEKSCQQFIYGGCLGNENKFDSLSDCESRCITMAEEVTSRTIEENDQDMAKTTLQPKLLEDPLTEVTAQPLDNDHCFDNLHFVKNCSLIVKGRYCTHQYYAKFCCHSCTLAGQLNPKINLE